MSYQVKEIFLTLQGEGHHTGRVAVFCRFSGCNLWSGQEKDRQTALCPFCDTDFVGVDGERGGKYERLDLVQAICVCWSEKISSVAHRFVVLTGGEPALQVDEDLVEALQQAGFFVAMETNGSLAVPENIDWICVSPKTGVRLQQQSGQELKLVYPQQGIRPEDYLALDFEYFYLQPIDSDTLPQSLSTALDYCFRHPQWSLRTQTHKQIGIP